MARSLGAGRKIALLIDCENSSADSIHGVLAELAEQGATPVRRACGNWKNASAWEEKLHPFAILPVQQFAYTKGKNAIDMCMTIDAMDLLYTENLDGFALVTSDSDFTPPVLKLLQKGKYVVGFGESKTPEPFRRACSLFINTDHFRGVIAPHHEQIGAARRSGNELRGDTELMNVLRSAVESMKEDDGWAHLGRIGHFISNNSSLSPKNYGYARWSDLIRALGYFDTELRDKHPYFRTRVKARQS